MTSVPNVSIIIPAYNAADTIADAIGSAINQSTETEVIVVDDGSDDATADTVSDYPSDNIRLIRQDRRGACAARNHGLSVAKGRYVKFLDADDVLADKAVSSQLHAIGQHKDDPSIIPYGKLVHVDKDLRFIKMSSGLANPDRVASHDTVERISELLNGNIQTSLPLHRRSIVADIGGFNPRLKRAHEYDLHLRLALAGSRFVRVDEISTYMRHHDYYRRISSTTPILDDPEDYLTNLINRRMMLETDLGCPLPSIIAAHLGASMWRYIRLLVRADITNVVPDYVEEAMYLDPIPISAGAVYGMLFRIVGPIKAERFLSVLRRILPRR